MSGADFEKGLVEVTLPQQNHVAASAPAPHHRPANPAALGMLSSASTIFLLSLYNTSARSIHHPNVVVGMAIFCGGLAQFVAGMWEYPTGTTFGAAAFASYGAFWMSYATILIPSSGVMAAFEGRETELASALGIYLVVWALVTFIFFVVSLGKNVATILVFGFLTLTFACLAGGEFAASAASTKAGGILGIITSIIAYYVGVAILLEDEAQPLFHLPLGAIHLKKD